MWTSVVKVRETVDEGDLDVTEVTIPSAVELYRAFPDVSGRIMLNGDNPIPYWLRYDENSVGPIPCYQEVSDEYGGVNHRHVSDVIGVRPMMRISNLADFDLRPGDKIIAGGKWNFLAGEDCYYWTVVSENAAIFDKIITLRPFVYDKDLPEGDFISSWENSSLKKELEEWAVEQDILPAESDR